MPGETEPATADPAGPRRRWPALLFSLAMMGAGAGAVAVSSGLDGRSSRVVGGNAPLNAGAASSLDVTAQNSPALVANPKDPANLVVASRVDTPRFSCALHTTADGGASWAETKLALPESDVVACFAPDAAFDANGALYVAYTSFANLEGLGTVPEAVWLARSSDGGRTFSAPAKVQGPLAFQMRLIADPAKAGRLYLTWLQAADSLPWGLATAGRPIMVSRSDDGGATWSTPVTVTPPARERVVAPAMALGAEGQLYLSYLDVGDDRLDYHGGHEGKGGEAYPGTWTLIVSRSVDSGQTWTEQVVDSKIGPAQRFLMLFPPTPSMAAGKNNSVFVGFHDARSGDADVSVWASADSGRTWGKGERVNDTATRDGTSQYLPALSVSPDGRLDVAYYDRRGDRRNVRNEVSLQSSFDDGLSFGRRLRLSDRSFDSTIGFGANREMPDLGSRLGLLATAKGALAVWADTRSEEREIGKQDLAKALVAFSDKDPLKTPLKIGGVVVAGLGAVVAGGSLAGGRSRRRQRQPAAVG